MLPGVLLALPIFGLVAATALLIVGLRGRRVDDHPLCRRCGFDLVGLPRESIVCSECGASLHHARAIRTGHRVRRAGMILLSLGLLFPSLLWIGIVAYVTAADVNWMSRKPVWLLLRDAETDGAALAELLTRLNNQKVSATNVDAVVAKALAMQADQTRMWNGLWGDLVQQGRLAGLVKEADWMRFVQQAPVLEMRARPEVARGDPIWVEVRLRELRLGSTWMPGVTGVETSRQIDGVECGDNATGGFFFRRGSGDRASGSLLRPNESVMTSMPAGSRTLSVTYDVYLSMFHGSVLPKTTAQVSTTFALRDPPAQTVTVEANAAAREEIQLSASAWTVRYFSSGVLFVQVKLAAPPSFDLAYDVFAVLPDGRECKLSPYTSPRGQMMGRAASCAGKVGRLPADVKTIDVVLRPNPDVALQSLTLNRLCAGEIWVQNVVLQRADTPKPLNPPRERVVR
jgi:hypothetical protein